MKYVCLIYQNEAQWATSTLEEKRAAFDAHRRLHETLQRDGIEWAGQRLEVAASAKSVRVESGVSTITDGPFAETREQLAGFYSFECSEAQALRYAGILAASEFGTFEVRPINSAGVDD